MCSYILHTFLGCGMGTAKVHLDIFSQLGFGDSLVLFRSLPLAHLDTLDVERKP